MTGPTSPHGEGRPPKPTRRKVLGVAATAFVGVAASRLLGLRDLDQRVAAATRRSASGAMAMMDAPESYDEAWAAELMGLQAAPATAAPDGSAPADTPPADPATTPRPAVAKAAVAPPASRVDLGPAAIPARGASFDWISPLDKEAGRVAHLLRRATFGATQEELDRAMSDGYARTVDRLLETPPAAPKELSDPQARSLVALQQWWLDHMTTSPTPFGEVMTLFWSGHFTSDYRKVGLQQPWIYWQNLSWRKMALGDLRSILKTVTIDPAMLRYLDLGISTGRAPNENYARELMELFTMGVGTYAETDVQGGAKALSGWRLPRANEPGRTGIVDPSRTYGGTVTFLGRTGRFDTDAVIDQILAQDVTATHLARTVLAAFLSPFPSAALVSRLAGRFRASKYDVKGLMRDVLLAPEFVAPETYRSLLRSPVEFAVSAARALGQPLGRLAAASGSGMGQALFDPPTVAGWPAGPGLISSSTMVARANFAAAAIGQVRPLPSAANAHATALDGVLGPQTVALLNATSDDRARWSIILSSPEFQLK